MDVLVLWSDGTKNVVCSRELKTYKNKPITVGCTVKMLYEKLWYKGKVVAVEELSESYISEDDMPLIKLKKKRCDAPKSTDSDGDVPLASLGDISKKLMECNDVISLTTDVNCNNISPVHKVDVVLPQNNYEVNESGSAEEYYDSDADPAFVTCEVKLCKQEVFAACPRCEILVCFEHLNEDITNCRDHGKTKEILTMATDEDEILPPLLPESFELDGADREENIVKKSRTNKKKILKLQRNLGKDSLYQNLI